MHPRRPSSRPLLPVPRFSPSGDAEQEELINRERKARETAGHVEELTGVEINPLPLQLAE